MRRLIATAAVLSTASLLPLTTTGQPAGAVVPGAALTAVPARPADSLVEAYGVGTHLSYSRTAYADVARVKQALVELGVRHVRDNLYSGRPDGHAAMREVASGTGIRFNLIMGRPASPETPAVLVRTIAEQLPTGVVESLEGANEWNLRGGWGWVGELRNHQRRLWEAAKAEPVTAGLPILAPALGKRSGYRQLGNLSKFADLGNAHNYPGGLPPSSFIDEVTRAERIVVPDAPVIFTESGYHNAMNTGSGHKPTLEAAAGEYVPKLLLEHFLRGTKRFYSYELLDQRPDAGLRRHEANFGLLRNDFTPKPAYLAMRNLLRLAADPGPAIEPGSLAYELQHAPRDLRQVLLQKRDGSFLLLLWRDVSLYDRIAEELLHIEREPVTLRLGRPSDLTVFRPTRSASPVSSSTGTTTGSVAMDGTIAAVRIEPGNGSAPRLAAGSTSTGTVPESTAGDATGDATGDSGTPPDMQASVTDVSGRQEGETDTRTSDERTRRDAFLALLRRILTVRF